MTVPVSDARSNANDQLARAAEVLKTSTQRFAVFEAVYGGKPKVKSVDDIAQKTGLSRKRVLTHGLKLASNGIVTQTSKNGQTAYEKDPFYAGNRSMVESLVRNPAKLAALPTKTHPQPRVPGSITIYVPKAFFDVERLTVDDIDSFKKVEGTKIAKYAAKPLTERAFKEGMQALVREPGTFKDWGGEKNDLWTTRVTFSGRRRTTAMAFKGKGMKGKLTPGKMGKNGDQIQRLYQTSADLYLLQYWAEIDQSVFELMNMLAIASSASNGGKKVYYLVMDGLDSQRLIHAYPKFFPGGVQ
jgi:hypothetical protein